MDEWMNGWAGGWMNGLKYRWLNGWIDGCLPGHGLLPPSKIQQSVAHINSGRVLHSFRPYLATRKTPLTYVQAGFVFRSCTIQLHRAPSQVSNHQVPNTCLPFSPLASTGRLAFIVPGKGLFYHSTTPSNTDSRDEPPVVLFVG